jgi:hypothetical protein
MENLEARIRTLFCSEINHDFGRLVIPANDDGGQSVSNLRDMSSSRPRRGPRNRIVAPIAAESGASPLMFRDQ